MKPRFRLTSSTDFKRVRRFGKSYAHPLVVLVAHPSGLESIRVGITTGRSLGSAVKRNRAKRRLRAAIGPFLENILPGWDLILIARQPILEAEFSEIIASLGLTLNRARLLREQYGFPCPPPTDTAKL